MRNVFELEPTTAILSEDPYIASYPHLLDYFRSKSQIGVSDVVCGAHMVYGWMPTILALYPNVKAIDLPTAAHLLTRAKGGEVLKRSEIGALAALVNNSLVGASKLLHFVSPSTYAIWDSKVYSFVHGKTPHNYQLSKVETYQDYLALLNELATEKEFQPFHQSVCKKVGYDVSPLRALELIMFLNASVSGRS